MSKEYCLLIAGEKSGEEHALSFFPQLKALCPEINFFGVGGDELQAQGMELLYHLKDFSSWGLVDVLKKLPFYIFSFKKILQEVERRNCKVAILIDFQDFNLRLARRLKKKGIKVLYYVAPQAWAWKSWRAKILGQAVHTLYAILPFEKEWFSYRGVSNVISVAHPLYYHYQQVLSDYHPIKNQGTDLRLVLLPGSRTQEVKHLFPLFINVIKMLKQNNPGRKIYCSVIQSPTISPAWYEYYQDAVDEIIPAQQMVKVLAQSHLALACSGTVTLSTALFEIPTLVCYRFTLLEEFIIRHFIGYRGRISLPNLILAEDIFPELIQQEANLLNVVAHLQDWIDHPQKVQSIQQRLKKLRQMVQGEEKNVPLSMAKALHGDP